FREQLKQQELVVADCAAAARLRLAEQVAAKVLEACVQTLPELVRVLQIIGQQIQVMRPQATDELLGLIDTQSSHIEFHDMYYIEQGLEFGLIGMIGGQGQAMAGPRELLRAGDEFRGDGGSTGNFQNILIL